MNQFKLLLAASVILMLGTACQKSADRKDQGQDQGQQGDKPLPADQVVKTKTTCEATRTYTVVKDGVNRKVEATFLVKTDSIDKDLDSKTYETEYKTTLVQKWFSVAEDGTKTETGGKSTVELAKSVLSIEQLEPNIILIKDHTKGKHSTLNTETQKYDTENIDSESETKKFDDGQMSYDIYFKVDGKEQYFVPGHYKYSKTSEQDGRIIVRTKTLMAPVQDTGKVGETLTLETSVKTCREEEVDSVDLSAP